MTTQSSLDEHRLGVTPDRLPFDDASRLAEISAAIVNQARRRVLIFSRDLDAAVYDRVPFLDGIKHLVINSRYAQVQLLLQDNTRVIKHGHRLVELARRLSSSVELRRPHPDYLEHAENFMLVDTSGVVYRKLATRCTGVASFHDPLQNQRLEAFFKEVWELSEPDPELRRLFL